MKKDQRNYLTMVFTPFTNDWILAQIILPCLQARERLEMEKVSKPWRDISLQYWHKRRVKKLNNPSPEKQHVQQPWAWIPPVLRPNLAVDFVKIYDCIEEYIKNRQLHELQKSHLRSQNVARELLEGDLTIRQAAIRAQSHAVLNCWIVPRTGVILGIAPAVLFNDDGSSSGFGPFHIQLVEKHDVPPKKIRGLSPEEIKRLPELQGLFSPQSLKQASNPSAIPTMIRDEKLSSSSPSGGVGISKSPA